MTMLLAIDTSTRTLSLALHDGDQILAETTWRTANYHTVELTPSIASMLGQGSVAPADLKAIAVALGPGSFTGLRIGLAAAKGLRPGGRSALCYPAGRPGTNLRRHLPLARRGMARRSGGRDYDLGTVGVQP